MIGIMGKKMGMTQIFSDKGEEVPVTVLEMGPCPVVGLFSEEKDGYKAAQLAFDPINKKNEKKVSKPSRGHYTKAGVKPHRFLREFRLEEKDSEVKIGDAITVDIFTDTHYVSVTSVSKGKGFAGVMKRHGFKGAQTMSHGTHEAFRHGGSIGMCEEPARVLKGKKMPGQFGNKKVKVLNLEVVKIFPEKNLMLVKGAVPGPTGGMVMVERSDRRERKIHAASEPKFVNPLKAAKRKGG